VTTIIIAWKEMVWLHQVHYTAPHPLMVPTYASQDQCQNQNKSCTAQCHIYDVHVPDKLTLLTTSFSLQKHNVLVTGSVSIIIAFKCYQCCTINGRWTNYEYGAPVEWEWQQKLRTESRTHASATLPNTNTTDFPPNKPGPL